ncbi:MAG: hypothetical protein M5R36_18930 [Deltaproteobacteria bacterium]|nr:hypothetical protein [Deltaproteobacteria bacterium]
MTTVVVVELEDVVVVLDDVVVVLNEVVVDEDVVGAELLVVVGTARRRGRGRRGGGCGRRRVRQNSADPRINRLPSAQVRLRAGGKRLESSCGWPAVSVSTDKKIVRRTVLHLDAEAPRAVVDRYLELADSLRSNVPRAWSASPRPELYTR